MNKDLEKAIVSVMLGEKKVLTAKQQQIDVHEPEKDELTSKDFEMLRAGKKAKQVKEEDVKEAAPIVAAVARKIASAAASPTGKKVIGAVVQQAAMSAVDKAAKKYAGNSSTNEPEEANEARKSDPGARVLKDVEAMEKRAKPTMADLEKNKNLSANDKDKLAKTAELIKREKEMKEETEQADEGRILPTGSEAHNGTIIRNEPPRSREEMLRQSKADGDARKRNTDLVHNLAAEIRKKKEMGEETERIAEAGMPSSVAKHKQSLKNMSPKEFANHPHYGKMPDKQLRSMAWSHGYGGPGTRGHDTYVDKRNQGLKEEVEQMEEGIEDRIDAARKKAEKAGKTIKEPKPEQPTRRKVAGGSYGGSKQKAEVEESYTFADYLEAAMKLHDEDMAVCVADEAYRFQDTSLIEAAKSFSNDSEA